MILGIGLRATMQTSREKRRVVNHFAVREPHTTLDPKFSGSSISGYSDMWGRGLTSPDSLGKWILILYTWNNFCLVSILCSEIITNIELCRVLGTPTFAAKRLKVRVAWGLYFGWYLGNGQYHGGWSLYLVDFGWLWMVSVWMELQFLLKAETE